MGNFERAESGSETVVDVWINKSSASKPQEQPDPILLSLDQEFDEIFPETEKIEDDVLHEALVSSEVPAVRIKLEPGIELDQINNAVAGAFEESFPEALDASKTISDGPSSGPANLFKTVPASPRKLVSNTTTIPGKPVVSPAVTPAGKSVSSPGIALHALVSSSSVTAAGTVASSPSVVSQAKLVSSPGIALHALVSSSSVTAAGTVASSPSVVSQAKLVSSPSKLLILNRPGTAAKSVKALVTTNPSTSNVVLNPLKAAAGAALQPPKNTLQNTKVLLSNTAPASSPTVLQASVVSTTSREGVSPVLKGVVSPNKLVIRNSSGTISSPTSNTAPAPVPCVIKPNAVTTPQSGNPLIKTIAPRTALTNVVSASSANALLPCVAKTNAAGPVNTLVPSSVKTNALQNVNSTNSLPNTVLASLPTNTTQSLTTSQPSALSPRITQSNQNAIARAPVAQTPNAATNPVSFVRYKAPDGTIRLLQVSHINRPKAPVTSAQNEAPPLVNVNTPPLVSTSVTQALISPKPDPEQTVSQSVVPSPRNPAPLVRLPAPSTVTPASKAPLLMFRGGKLYLIRPAGSNPPGNVPAANQNVSFIRQPSGQILVTRSPAPAPAAAAVQTQNSVVNKSGSEQPTRFVPPVPALVKNTMRVIPTKSLMPDKASVVTTGSSVTSRPSSLGATSAHRPGVSLLKSNLLQQSPAPSPTCSPLSSPSSSPRPPTSTAITHRVVFPTPASSPVESSTHRTRLYKQMLSTVVRSCPAQNSAGGVGRAVRWMVRNLPLISSEARNEEYLLLHPYSAPDLDTFLGWNLGKQRACEWMRAKTVWRLLQDVGWSESDIWSTREILIWARFHGYTPGLPLSDPGSDVSSTSLEEVCQYKPINEEIAEWLDAREKINDSKTTGSELSDEEVDVTSVNLPASKVCVKREPMEGSADGLMDFPEEMAIENNLQGAGAFVNGVLSSIGIQLDREQLVPGILYPAAQRVLIQAVHSLIDDLVRRSLAEAWGQNIAKSPRSIEVPNVCSAIIGRPEFDFLSCAGLAEERASSSAAEPSSSKTLVLKPS